jgi:hypothetical protein
MTNVMYFDDGKGPAFHGVGFFNSNIFETMAFAALSSATKSGKAPSP